MTTRNRIVTLTAYYHTLRNERVSVSLADLSEVWATSDTLEGAIDAVKDKLRKVAKANFEAGGDVPWKVRVSCPDGWDTIMLRVRLGPKPTARWYHLLIGRLLYAGGWLLIHGIYTIENLAKWVESKRRK